VYEERQPVKRGVPVNGTAAAACGFSTVDGGQNARRGVTPLPLGRRSVPEQREDEANEANDEVEKGTTSVHVLRSLSCSGRPALGELLLSSAGLVVCLSESSCSV
jgi:hypothetical protein